MAKTNGKVRVGMIGAGRLANSVHYPSLASFDDVEFAGICDLAAKPLNETADKYNIEKRYSDYRKMIEETSPDAVYVIGQPQYMYDIWIWCLNQGLNLYIEKPMGITIHQARNLAYLAEKNGCVTQVSFQRRNCPLVVFLRNQCLERGPIFHASVTFYKGDVEPFLDARDHMMDDGVHVIDTLRWMCGGEVVEIHSLAKHIQVPDINFIPVLLQFDNGAVGIMVNNFASGRRIFRVEMHSRGITAEANIEDKGYVYADGDTVGTEYDTREVAGGEEGYVFGGNQSKNRDFIDCLKSGGKPSSHFSDAVKTMEVAEKILAQTLLKE